MNEAPSLTDLSDIAVIGISCRFPGAKDTDTFWQNLRDGVESISFFSDEALESAGIDLALRENPHYVKASGVLSDIDLFDAFFFGYSPGEASTMDPQHRIFLECAWEAIEKAGYDPETYQGLIGVYAGAGMNTYLYNNLHSNRAPLEPASDYHVMIASDKDFLSTKASYKLNLKGPSITVQTACSTSLVAVHLACQSLRNGECDMALAGGISIRVPHNAGYLYQEGMILSADGHCRAFDAQAQGTVIGSGAGIVVLKLLVDALADGDHIHAVIKGSAINNDGSLKAGYTAPSLDAQAAVIQEAQGIAGVTADSITYIEAHGTGTAIGDPIEIAALTKAFRAHTPEREFCAVGSVKTNIGHLDVAAGVAGLIKAILALEHKQIPPSLNFKEPNPRIKFASSPFYVNTALSDWETKGAPRRVGVSSFGIGGTNAHIILEEAPNVQPPGEETRPWQLLLLSAKSAAALDAATSRLSTYLEQNVNCRLADVAYTLQIGRRAFSHKRFLVCRSREEAVAALNNPQQTVFGSLQEATERPVAFMFAGQGSQYVNMALELYQTEPIFRQHVDICCHLLEPHLGFDLRTVLYPDEKEIKEATKQLEQTAMTQPALFVIEYALAQLLMAWGVRPQAVIGHSIGEYVAACLAGVFSLADALALVAARGRLMQQLPGGAMLALSLSEQEILPFLNEELSLAAMNGPSRCVVSGSIEAVEALQARLTKRGIMNQRLHTSHAFHSPMMDPILEPFMERVQQVSLNPPQIPCLSNVTGTWLTAVEATDPGYWTRHLRQPVRFANGISELLHDPQFVLLEVGPGRTLSTLTRQHPDKEDQQVVLSSIRHPQDTTSDTAFLLTTLGKLWLAGVHIDWPGFYEHEQRHRLVLPTYPFERQPYWIEPKRQAGHHLDVPKHTAVAKKADISDWFYVPSWKRSVLAPHAEIRDVDRSGWLIFADEYGLGTALAACLREKGQDVAIVKPGSAFMKVDDHTYTLNPAQANEYEALISALAPQKAQLLGMVHLWGVTTNEPPKPGLDTVDITQRLTFYSLLFLTQALGRHNFTDPLDLTVISNGMQEVTGEKALHPVKATLLGPVKIIPHEYPNITCRSVDITLPQSETGIDQTLTDLLLTEIITKSDDTMIAYRGNHRWVETFQPVRLGKPTTTAPGLRQGGVYLITGGLGGLGLVLAKYLAETVQAKLILVGRSAFPKADEWASWVSAHGTEDPISQKITKVKELEALGAELLVISADVTNTGHMQQAIAHALEHFGQINGVVHAAGVPGGGMMQLKTGEAAASIMTPKVEGTIVLDMALRDVALDFFILCSSLNSIVPRIGQVDYCAANAFMDAFANTANGTLKAAINWDTWKEVGMAAEAAKQLAQAPGVSKAAAHPLLDRCVAAYDGWQVYSTDFRVDKHWELYEHGVIGKATLPGTTYLEMVRAAFMNDAGDRVIDIQDVHFLTPLIVEDHEEKQVYTILKKQDDAFEFLVVSQPDPEKDVWQEHARGKIAILEAANSPKHSLEDIERRCHEPKVTNPLDMDKLGDFSLQRRPIVRGVSGHHEPLVVPSIIIAETEEDHGSQARFMEFGPRWHSLKWVKLGADEGLAFFELPEAFSADMAFYKLHPALLDFATSFLRLFKTNGSYLPLSYKRLKIKGPLPERVYSYARYSKNHPTQGVTLTFDIILLDEQGTALVEIEEFAVIKVQDVRKLGTFSRSRLTSSVLFPDAAGPGNKSGAGILKDFQEGMLSAEGVEVFRRILGSGLSRVIVSSHDLLTRIEQAQAQRLSLFTEDIEDAESQKPKHPRPSLVTAYAAPRNETEKKLADIWQEVLGIDQVGIHDNFFELGGDSLLITRIHSKFRESLHSDLSIASLLQYSTIADLSQFLEKTDDTKQPSFEKVQNRADKQKEALKRKQEAMMKRRKGEK